MTIHLDYEQMQELTRAWDQAERDATRLRVRIARAIYPWRRFLARYIGSLPGRLMCRLGFHRWHLSSDAGGWPIARCSRVASVTRRRVTYGDANLNPDVKVSGWSTRAATCKARRTYQSYLFSHL